MNVTTIGLDVAKNVFWAHGVDGNGKVVVRKKLTRGKVLEFFVNLPPCLVGLEACPGAQLKATSFSSWQSAQRKRRKPWARMPQSRKASNSL